MIITNEMVEIVARATATFFKADKQPDMSGDPFAKMLPHKKRECFDAARAALEAVAPMLIAQGAAETDEARALIEAYFTAVFEMVDPKIFAEDLISCLSAKGFKICRAQELEK